LRERERERERRRKREKSEGNKERMVKGCKGGGKKEIHSNERQLTRAPTYPHDILSDG